MHLYALATWKKRSPAPRLAMTLTASSGSSCTELALSADLRHVPCSW